MIISVLRREISVAPSRTTRRRTRWVTVQKSSRMVAALRRADMLLTATAAMLMLPPKRVTKKRAASMKMGLPGGWPTSSFAPCVMNSGQSQKLAVGSIVSRYVTAATRKHSHPMALLTMLYRLMSIKRSMKY